MYVPAGMTGKALATASFRVIASPTASRCGADVVQTPFVATLVTLMSHVGDAAVPTSLPSRTSLLPAAATSPFAVTRITWFAFGPVLLLGFTSYVYDR